MKIWMTSGEPYEAGNREYTPAEAAKIVSDYPWAAIDGDGDVVVGMYRTRAAWGGGKPVAGAKLAQRLARA